MSDLIQLPRNLILIVVTAISLLLGILIGQYLPWTPTFDAPSSYYQAVIRGHVSLQAAPVDQDCPDWPDDRISLSKPIVTDGETLGFALGSTALELSPFDDGNCYYYNKFNLLLSPTGNYELAFAWNDEFRVSDSIAAEPDSPSSPTNSLEPSEIWWAVTTIGCPDEAIVCERLPD